MLFATPKQIDTNQVYRTEPDAIHEHQDAITTQNGRFASTLPKQSTLEKLPLPDTKESGGGQTGGQTDNRSRHSGVHDSSATGQKMSSNLLTARNGIYKAINNAHQQRQRQVYGGKRQGDGDKRENGLLQGTVRLDLNANAPLIMQQSVTLSMADGPAEGMKSAMAKIAMRDKRIRHGLSRRKRSELE